MATTLSINRVVARFRPQIEQYGRRRLHVRLPDSSDPVRPVLARLERVAKRNRAAWKIEDAIRNLNETARQILDAT